VKRAEDPVSIVDSTGSLRRRRGSDYAELLTQVRQAGPLDRRPAYYTVKIDLNAALVIAGWTMFVLLGDSRWQLLAAAYHGRLELTKFHTPSGRGGDRHAPANTPGIRHVAFAVDDIGAVVASSRAPGAELVGEVERYEDSYRLRYVRGPEGIIVELAEQIG
jgi:catechol 2,3-dioxygenase-like lactoylglutathione lyase family enzyme